MGHACHPPRLTVPDARCPRPCVRGRGFMILLGSDGFRGAREPPWTRAIHLPSCRTGYVEATARQPRKGPPIDLGSWGRAPGGTDGTTVLPGKFLRKVPDLLAESHGIYAADTSMPSSSLGRGVVVTTTSSC